MKRNLAGSAILLTGLWMVTGCTNSQKPVGQNPADMAVPVTTYVVDKKQVTGVDTYPGTITPLKEVELRAQVGGYITAIYVQDGQDVKAGQKLYEIDKSKYLSSYNQLKSQLAVAKANYEKAKKDADRYTTLAEQDAIAKQRVDYALTDLSNAESQVTAAQANLENAATDLTYATIVAPFTGTIGISQVKLGTLVSPGTSLINTISSNNPIAVDFSIGEQEISRFLDLQKKGSSLDSLFTIVLPDQSEYQAAGKIETIDRAVDAQTGTIKVRVSFPNADRRLRAGMSCNIRVLNDNNGLQIIIPTKAITEQLGEFFTYVVTDSSTVEQRPVTLGSHVQDKVVIKEGLTAGETVVSEGLQNLRDGVKVQTEQTEASNK